MTTLAESDAVARAVSEAIRAGDLPSIASLLQAHRELATATIRDARGHERSLLHIATDWPGHYPRVASVIAALIAAGADVNARFIGPHTETPLHWAASTNDLAALNALLDAGATIDADGAVISGGTALADAVAFGQWDAAKRLSERGACANLWQAAALGMLPEVKRACTTLPPPAAEEIDRAFWCACHGAAVNTAAYLLDRGANLNWVGFDGLTPLGAGIRSEAHALVTWLRERGATKG